MNFPQLIEWAKKNDVRNRSYYGDRYEDRIFFTENQDVICDCVPINETFTVETETEITEDTVIPNLVEVYHSVCKQIGVDVVSYKNISISEIYDGQPTKAFYILNDDLTMTLIWRDGKLVE
ncbi:hypothetical protein ACWEWU_14595 [Staphylococcus xylosus]